MDMKPFLLKNFIVVATGEIGWKKYTSTETVKAFAEHNGISVTKATNLSHKVLHRVRLFNDFKMYGLKQAIFKTQVHYYSCEIDIPESEQNLIANVICRNYSSADEFLAATSENFIKCRGVGKKYAQYMTLVQNKISKAGYVAGTQQPKKLVSGKPNVSFIADVRNKDGAPITDEKYLKAMAKTIISVIKRTLELDKKMTAYYNIFEIKRLFCCNNNPRTRRSLTYGYDTNNAANIEDLIQYEIIDGIVHVDLYSVRNLCMNSGEVM